MNTNVISEFENEVRRVVRRGSKSSEFESPIEEISAHFADLVQEEIRNGASPHEAELLAKKRLGSLLTIGMQILNTPSRVSRGIRVQKFALLTLTVSAFNFIALEYFGLRGLQETVSLILGLTFFVIYLASAFSFGLGILLSSRALWKTLLALFPVSAVLFGLAATAFMPLFETYLNQPGMQTYKVGYEQSTLMSCLNYGFQLSERLIGFYVVIALISFMTGRIWLTRLSWFRLTLR